MFKVSELSFLAEQEIVTIIPRQQCASLPLLSGPLPALKVNARADVPIWLALFLKRQKRAIVVCPDWLSVESLTSFITAESKVLQDGTIAGFSKVPYYWLEVSELLLDGCSDDIPDVEEVRRLLQQLRELRRQKVRDGLEVLEGTVLHMDNIGCGEINEIRELYSETMNTLRALQDTRDIEDEDQDNEEGEEMQESD